MKKVSFFYKILCVFIFSVIGCSKRTDANDDKMPIVSESLGVVEIQHPKISLVESDIVVNNSNNLIKSLSYLYIGFDISIVLKNERIENNEIEKTKVLKIYLEGNYRANKKTFNLNFNELMNSLYEADSLIACIGFLNDDYESNLIAGVLIKDDKVILNDCFSKFSNFSYDWCFNIENNRRVYISHGDNKEKVLEGVKNAFKI